MESQHLALVTGGAHRLGRAFSEALARSGYALCIHYLTAKFEAESLARELSSTGTPVHIVQADLTSPADISGLFQQVDELGQPLHVLVNSAGILRAGDARHTSVKEWDEVLDLNLRAAFLCAQEAAARMKSGGLIVNITDVGARKAWSRFPAYSVSKAGLEALTGVLARAYAPNIRVNAIAPGLVLRSEETAESDWLRLIQRLPLKRAGSLEEVAAAFEFLLTNEYITGQTLTVDGGYSLLG